jgi:predicted dehydrogenase
MRVAFLGVSHWHTPFYIEPAAALDDCTIVGVSDPSEAVAAATADRFATRGFVDYRRMCEETRPDVVFALGRHVDMAEAAAYLIEAGIPTAMEKPCGVSVAEVERLEELARSHDAWFAVPFVYRMSRFASLIAEQSPGKPLLYGMFRQIPGNVARYRDWGVAWNLDRRLAGGGCTLNLSIHFFDLVRVLAPAVDWTVAAATMSRSYGDADVEDFSATLLVGDGCRASIETGYFYPGPGGEVVLSVNVGGDYYRWDGDRRQIFLTRADGSRETFDAAADQVASYAPFVEDTLRRVQQGLAPQAGLTDMAHAARLAEAAYRLAGYDDFMV